ncbi:MAG: potassium channel protein [Phycisphaerales bacterium]|nr:potassium channel protein [Phycisphaerales bacterium]
MPHSPRLDRLKDRATPAQRAGWWLWREWCFARAVARRLAWRAGLLAAVLLSGGLLVRTLESREVPLVEAVYGTWTLVFAQPPGPFPAHPALRAMYFVMPLLGLTVIIETLVGMAEMVRDRRRMERTWCTTMAQSLNDHIVLVGLGRLGFRTFTLLRRLGERVVVIESDPHNQFLEEVRGEGSPLLIGDARNDRVLEDANIARAKAVVLATNNDLANLEVALDARRMAPKIRVVLRMFDQNMADKVSQGFNIHIAMSQSAISAPAFATAAIEPSIVSGTVVDDRLVVMQRWTLREGDGLAGRTVGEVLAERRVGVVELRAAGAAGAAALFPPPQTRLAAGDAVLVQGPYETLASLRSP